ncbi:MAG: hypothetical protein JKY74_04470 [Shewanella sp.]|nr:hypothetical protein [Shewanella sp.]
MTYYSSSRTRSGIQLLFETLSSGFQQSSVPERRYAKTVGKHTGMATVKRIGMTIGKHAGMTMD